jgi:hypothetical protein
MENFFIHGQKVKLFKKYIIGPSANEESFKDLAEATLSQ